MSRARAEIPLSPAMRTLRHLVAVIWILMNLYVWGVMSLPAGLTGRLPPRWWSHYASHRALLTKVFYRPYLWSPEGR